MRQERIGWGSQWGGNFEAGLFFFFSILTVDNNKKFNYVEI